MIQSQHLSQDDLVQLIKGDGESDQTRAVGEHLHQCQECREALDALTAKSEIWQKAPQLLGDISNSLLSDTGLQLHGPNDGTMDFSSFETK